MLLVVRLETTIYGLYRCLDCDNFGWVELPPPEISKPVIVPSCCKKQPMEFAWQWRTEGQIADATQGTPDDIVIPLKDDK